MEGYNEILSYSRVDAEKILKSINIVKRLRHCCELLVRCFGKLNCKIKVPQNVVCFELVQKDVMTDSESDSENTNLGSKFKNEQSVISEPLLQQAPNNLSDLEKIFYQYVCYHDSG